MKPVPTEIQIVFFIIFVVIISTKALDHSHDCSRPCAVGNSFKKCKYEFIISEWLSSVSSTCNASRGIDNEESSCSENVAGKSPLVINGKSPGPTIEICLGDTIEVFVYNKLAETEVSLHWHGIRQKNFVYMDGVTMVTQCPILPYSGFQYEIKPEAAGTYFYHAHSVLQQGDGLYGSLTVRGPENDSSQERMFILSSRSQPPLTHISQQYPVPSKLLVNGQTNGLNIFVESGHRYLWRLINANVLSCPVSIAVVGHSFKVLATDGNVVDHSTLASHIVVFPGERFDVTLKAKQPPGRYLISVQGLQECRNIIHEAFLYYDDTESNATVIRKPEVYLSQNNVASLETGHNCHEVAKTIVCALDLRGRQIWSTEKDSNEEPEETVYVPFDVKTFDAVTNQMTDYRYNIFGFSYYPVYLSLTAAGARIPQINGMTFKYSSSPILTQSENVPDELVCSLEKRSKLCDNTPLFCECLQVLEIQSRKLIELILIDEGFGGNTSYTFHVHGYNVSVVGLEGFERPILKEEIISLNREGRLHRNVFNPPRKDSFVVPNKGYAILHFWTDNPGYWLWEVRSTGISPALSGPVMQFLMKVGTHENFPVVPINFPTCGNNKGPDLIFETN